MILPLNRRYMFSGQSVAWGVMGQGEPLVLVHGTPFSSQVWRRIAPQLAKSRHVFYFDLLGYGQSEMRDGQDVSLGVQNNLLAEIVAHWNLKHPSVLCHDFGAATVLRAAALSGLRYSGVTMFDAVALSPWGSPFVQHVRSHEAAFRGLPAYAHDAMLRAYLQGAAHLPLNEQALAIYMKPWQGAMGQAAFYRQIAQMDQAYTDEIWTRGVDLGGNVKLLWGTEDRWIPVQQGERLANLLKCGPVELVPDCGHLMQDDAPEAIVAAVLNPR